MQGLELSRRFHETVLGPWLARAAPGLPYAAGLLGYGSEVLGFDDPTSRDHAWGPRVLLFLEPDDARARADALLDGFAAAAPATFLGVAAKIEHAPPARPGQRRHLSHGVEVWTLAGFVRDRLATGPDGPRDAREWLGLSEQRLLGLTAGAVFHDDVGALTALRRRLAAFPADVRLHKLACQWRRIAEEQPFVGRTGALGDELGSRIIAGRLARDVMRLGFLIEGRYAPYPKWFGAAFARLACAERLLEPLGEALAASRWEAREAALAEAYLRAAQLQLESGLPGAAPRIQSFHDRPFRVINAEEIMAAVRAAIGDAELRALPLIGSLDQVTDSTPVIEAPARAGAAMRALLDDGEAGAFEEA